MALLCSLQSRHPNLCSDEGISRLSRTVVAPPLLLGMRCSLAATADRYRGRTMRCQPLVSFAAIPSPPLALAGPASRVTSQRASVATFGPARSTDLTARAAARSGSRPVTATPNQNQTLPPPPQQRKDHRNELPHKPEQLQHLARAAAV